MLAGDNPATESPNSARSASPKSFVDTPFRYSQGNIASTRFVFFRYGGKSSERKHRPEPGLPRVRSTWTRTGSTPFNISRDGR